MGIITSANAANAVLKLVATKALEALTNNLVMANIVNRNYENDFRNGGDTVNVPIPGTMTANNLAEGGSVAMQSPNLGNAQLILDTHAEASFAIPDHTKVIEFPELLNTYMSSAIAAIAEKVDLSLLSLYTGFTANTAVGTGGTAITEAVIDAAEVALFNSKVPANHPKYLVVDGTTYGTIRQLPRFSEDRITADQGKGVVDGFVGRLKGFSVYRHQAVVKTGGGPVTTNNIAFGRDALMLAVRPLPQPLPGTGAIAEYVNANGLGIRAVMTYNQSVLGQQVSLDILYGVAVLRNAFGIQVRS